MSSKLIAVKYETKPEKCEYEEATDGRLSSRLTGGAEGRRSEGGGGEGGREGRGRLEK